MFPSHKTARLRALPASAPPTYARRRPNLTYCHSSTHRYFSWGCKGKYRDPHAGKGWKSFSSEGLVCKNLLQRQLYRGTFWKHQYPIRRCLPRYLRLSSSWGKSNTGWKTTNQDAKSKDEPEYRSGLWSLSGWQARKEQQFDDFVKRLEAEVSSKEKRYRDLIKKAEEDPFGLLFGRHWAKETDGADVGAKDHQQPNTSDKGQGSRPKTENPVPDHGPPMNDQRSSKPKTNGDKQSKHEAVGMERLEQEYEIDPITMRKVPKRTPPPASTAASVAGSTSRISPASFDIPVKPFRTPRKDSPSTQRSSNGPPKAEKAGEFPTVTSSQPQSTKSWLAQEGFGSTQEKTSADNQPSPETEDVKPRVTATQIESALDRHIKGRSSGVTEAEPVMLHDWAKENTTEDIDLLRSSDVRATAGLRGKAARESDAEKQARQRKLEEEYDKRSLAQEAQLAQEIAAEKFAKDRSGETEDSMAGSWVNEISDGEVIVPQTEKPADSQTLEASNPEPAAQKPSTATEIYHPSQVDKIRTQIVPLKVRLDTVKADYEALRQRWLIELRRLKVLKKTNKIHEDEVKAQKQAMEAMEIHGVSKDNAAPAPCDKGDDQGDQKIDSRSLHSFLPGEGDVASNVHEFAGRDRWYKQRAPHAMEEDNMKLQKLAKDRELIREVKSIYEDTYGTIDTNHRQLSQSEEESEHLSTSENQVPLATSTPVSSSTAADSTNQEIPTSTSSKNSDALAIIQELLNGLRQAQSLIQDHHNSVQESSTPDNTSTNIQASKAYEQAVLQIAKSALKLTRASPGLPGSILARYFGDTGVIADSGKASTDRAPSSPAGIATKAVTQTPATPSVYRILAYDSATQKVISSPKTTSLAPFSKEQPLMPVEALEVLNNPGKFLPHVMTLYNKGYNVVSGASNILVFKREAKGDELAAAKHAEAIRKPNPIDGTIASTGNFASPTGFVNHDPPIPLEELEQHYAASASASKAIPEPASSETSADAQASSNKVRREEEVFSGRRRGGWQENDNSKRCKNKNRRRQKSTVPRMLLTGTVTAACCYAIGVVSEMVRH